MSHNDSEVLFDRQLELDRPLAELWQEAEPFSENSLRKDQRLHQDSGILLRELIRFDFPDETADTTEARAIVHGAGKHMELLRRFGMCIVSHTNEINDMPDFPDMEDEDAVVGYGGARFVTDSVALNQSSVRRDVPYERIETLVFDPVKRYIDWRQLPDGSYAQGLSDIYRPDQYSWQHTSGILFLHDIDPIMDPSHSYPGMDLINLEESFKDVF